MEKAPDIAIHPANLSFFSSGRSGVCFLSSIALLPSHNRQDLTLHDKNKLKIP